MDFESRRRLLDVDCHRSLQMLASVFCFSVCFSDWKATCTLGVERVPSISPRLDLRLPNEGGEAGDVLAVPVAEKAEAFAGTIARFADADVI